MKESKISSLRVAYRTHRIWPPCKIGMAEQSYSVFAYVGKRIISKLLITVNATERVLPYELDDFWFVLDKKPEIVRRPVVSFKRTVKQYRGQKISEGLLVMANRIFKEKYGQPLASHTTFSQCADLNWKEKGYAEFPGKRAWQRLEERGLAEYKPINGQDRWVMK